jgi:hypothetical protein
MFIAKSTLSIVQQKTEDVRLRSKYQGFYRLHTLHATPALVLVYLVCDKINAGNSPTLVDGYRYLWSEITTEIYRQKRRVTYKT